MRIALVSPYSWTYPGGVTRHIEALAECLLIERHEVRVLAPYDPPDRAARRWHRGGRPQATPPPDYLIPLGGTVGIRANGAVSNVSLSPHGAAVLHRELRTGGYDVVHIHEPIAPAIGWVATDWTPVPLVATFHTYNEHWFSHGIATLLGARRMLNRLHVRIAVSEPAAWTGRRFFGGHYRVIPNGVHFDADRAAQVAARPTAPRLRIVFVGQPVARKGLPLLLRAFEALREQVPAELTVIGPEPVEVSAQLVDDGGVRALGKVDDDRKRLELERADVLCAPSLGGESFGMVLTEAFAAATPVVASDIPGYRDVVRPGVDGILVPPGDAQAIAEALYTVYQEPARRAEMAEAATRTAARFAWPQLAERVLNAYQDAIATPPPLGRLRRAAVRVGALPADLQPRAPARRLPTLQPERRNRHDARTRARRIGLVLVSLGVAALGVVAIRKVGVHQITSALARTSVPLVIAGLAVMCASMVLRGAAWHAALRAGLPDAPIRLRDTMRALFVGVLVSSILPASLGEPSRAVIVVRRSGRRWDALPVVLGTMMSQTVFNVVALAVLGGLTFGSVDLFGGRRFVLFAAVAGVVLALLVVVGAPAVLAHAGHSRRLQRIQTVAAQLRMGLAVFRQPRLAAMAAGAQFGAWGLQCVSVYLVLAALHLADQTGFIGAVAVLFAVNVTMLLPVTPGDVGVFQAATAAVLHAGWQVPFSAGVAVGVVLQAVELIAALVMGGPALLLEGLSWRQLISRPPSTVAVQLPPPVSVRRETSSSRYGS
jgi:phosphatidylinositol alpha-mannosyltransferase